MTKKAFFFFLLIMSVEVVAGQDKVIFKDNFRNNKHKWPIIADTGFNVLIKNKALTFEKQFKNRIDNGCQWYNKQVRKLKTERDFHISFTATIIYWDDVSNHFDFQWGLIDESDSLNPKTQIHQLDFSDKEARLSKFEQGKGWEYFDWTDLYDENIDSTLILKPLALYKVDIIQKDGMLTVRINDMTVYNFSITPFKGNSIGVQQCLRSKWAMSKLIIRQ